MKQCAAIFLSGIILCTGAGMLPAQQFSRGDTLYVQTAQDPLNLRTKPGGKIVGAAPKGAAVTVVGDDGTYQDGYWWVRVRYQPKSGKALEGFVAADFLSPFAPGSLAQAGFVGLVRSHEGADMQIRPLALRAGKAWVGVSGSDETYLRWAKAAAKRKQSLVAADGGAQAGILRNVQYGEVGGCQVSEGLTAANPGLKSRYNRPYVVSKGLTFRDFQLTRIVENLPDSKKTAAPEFEPLVKELSRRAQLLFSKGGVPGAQLKQNFNFDALYRFRNLREKRSYAVARFSVAAVRKDDSWAPEEYYVAMIVRLAEDQRTVDAVVFDQFQQLSGDQMGYGGQYYFSNLTDLNDDGAPEIIFLHYGFDAAGYSIHGYDAKRKAWRAIVEGGGDAC